MTGTATFNLPIATLSAAGNYLGLISDLPKLTLDASGITGDIAAAEFDLPLLTLSVEGISGDAGEAVFNLPILTLEIAGIQNGLGSAAFDLPVLVLSAEGATGQFGVAQFELPVLTLAASGLHSGAGSAAFNLPVLFLSAEGGLVLPATYRTWVLNTRKNALTEYNFAFNSYALFNGQILAASAAGVVVLGAQALDGSTAITGRARTGKSDYGETHLKRVPRLYVGGEFGGDVLFRTIVDATGTRTYRLTHNHVDGMQQRRVPIGKGPKARYWQYELEGETGADFTIENVLAYPTGLRRRVM